MIKLITNQNNGKVIEAKFDYLDINLTIPVDVIAVRRNEPENAGNILEQYRNKVSNNAEDADIYYRENKAILTKILTTLNVNEELTKTECYFIFLPRDNNRKLLLREFRDVIFQKLNNFQPIDYSTYFYKVDNSKSIVNGLNKNDFCLTLPKSKLLNSILIIDDVIAKGDTINYFLEHLVDNENVDKNSKIHLCCISNNDRLEIKLTMDKIKEIMNNSNQ